MLLLHAQIHLYSMFRDTDSIPSLNMNLVPQYSPRVGVPLVKEVMAVRAAGGPARPSHRLVSYGDPPTGCCGGRSTKDTQTPARKVVDTRFLPA